MDSLDQDNHIHFRYIPPSLAGKKEYFGCRVELVHTEPHFGGRRSWFSCPGLSRLDLRWKRVGVLYQPAHEHRFACRTCWDLTYQSQKSWDKDLPPFLRKPMRTFHVWENMPRKNGSEA